MKLTFAEALNTSAYQTQAAAAAKVSIVVATLVCSYAMIFSDLGFGLWWLLIIPVVWFAVSLFLAMPVTLFRFWLASVFSENPSRARFATGVADIISFPVEILIVYYALKQLHRVVS